MNPAQILSGSNHDEVIVIAPGHHHLQCLLITKIKVSEELLEEHGTEPSVR